MRIVHFSDTHLGFQAYRTNDPTTGLNRRELDVYEAFRQAVDKILELKPDVVLHSGDLFDSVRPGNQALSVAFEELRRLGEANIPLIVISGNHSTPRLRGTSSIFRLFDLPEFPLIFPVYKGEYEQKRFNGLTIHAVPQCLTHDEYNEQLTLVKADPDARFNVLMLHATVAGAPEFSMGEFTEQVVPEKYLGTDFDYIALGHFHNKVQVRPHAFYAGSIERLTFNEVGRDKGVLEVDLETKEVIFHKLDLRPMGDLANIDAAGLNADELLTAIEHAVGEKKDEIIRVTIDNVSQETQGGFDYNRLKELMRREIHFEVKMVKEDTSEETSAVSPAIGNLHDEFIAFMTGKPAGKDHDKLLELGLDYLDRAARDRA